MSKSKVFDLEKLFDAILSSNREQALKDHGEIIEKLKNFDMAKYDLYVRYEIDHIVDCLHDDIKAAFIYGHYNYVESNFYQLIKSREGVTCSRDKSRYVVRELYQFFNKGEDFDVESKGPDEKFISEGKEYKVFFKPTSLTNKGCLEFFEAIWAAYYGKHLKLFEFYQNLVKKENKNGV